MARDDTDAADADGESGSKAPRPGVEKYETILKKSMLNNKK